LFLIKQTLTQHRHTTITIRMNIDYLRQGLDYFVTSENKNRLLCHKWE